MADDYIQVLPDGSGKKIDNSSLTVAGQFVYRQRINFADPSNPLGIASVTNSDPGASEYGVTVRVAGTATATLTGSGVPVTARGDGFLRVAIDPYSLFYDPFETLNTTDVWTLGGTTAPSISAGALTFPAGTGAGGTSFAMTKPAFTPGSSALLQLAALVTLEQGTVTGNQRFWGLGVVAGSPTPALPITNGTVFEIDSSTGALQGSVYSGSTRTKVVPLARPTDGLVHRYAIYYKSSRVYFEIDSTVVGSVPFPNPSIAALSVIAGSVNGSSAPSTAAVLQLSLIGLSDTGRNSTKLSDGAFPWRTATIKVSGSLAAMGDSALVITPHPSASFPIVGATQPTTIGTVTANTGIIIGGSADLTTASNLTVSVKGTYAGVVLNFEVSDDAGATWFPVMGQRGDNGLAESSTAALGSVNRTWTFATAGFNRFRVRSSAWTSGTATVTIDPGTLPMVPVVAAVTQSPARTSLVLFNEGTTGVSSGETTLQTQTSTGFGSVSALANTATVPTGRTFRVTGITIGLTSTAAAVVSARFRIRIAISGTASLSSPILYTAKIGFEGTPAAGSVKTLFIPLPEGLDIPGGASILVSHLETATSSTVDAAISGYLY